MKLILPVFFLFFSFCSHAQEREATLATALYREGMALLESDETRSFDKVRALGKFRQSRQLLHADTTAPDSLREATDRQLRNLAGFFSGLTNPDSLLATTRFFPDSVFQSDTRYTPAFKSLIRNILVEKRRKVRKAFFDVDSLNLRTAGTQNDDLNFTLSFENYWPLEVIEFEQQLEGRENLLRNTPRTVRSGLLYSMYSQQLKNLRKEISLDSLGKVIGYVRQQQEAGEARLAEIQQKNTQMLYTGLGVIAVLLLASAFALRRSYQQRNSMNQKLLEEKKRADELLLNILPAEVARQLKSRAAAKAHLYEGVSVLFTDFQNFSQIAKQLSPEQLVKELDYCFSEFDRIVDKYRLQKIKTIGDAYMCVGGLYTQGSSHVNRAIFAALEMQLFLSNLKKKRTSEGHHFFEARIGIHTGPVVAGVVGTKKFAFDIWGDTVNVAQQMEAHSEPGKVNISGETYELVKEQFVCTQRGRIVVKNKVAFEMYYVDRVIDGTAG